MTRRAACKERGSVSKVSFMANHVCSFCIRGVTVRPLSLSFSPFVSVRFFLRFTRIRYTRRLLIGNDFESSRNLSNIELIVSRKRNNRRPRLAENLLIVSALLAKATSKVSLSLAPRLHASIFVNISIYYTKIAFYCRSLHLETKTERSEKIVCRKETFYPHIINQYRIQSNDVSEHKSQNIDSHDNQMLIKCDGASKFAHSITWSPQTRERRSRRTIDTS